MYMDPPSKFPTENGKVCKLKKAMYGLKLSPKAWLSKLGQSMKEYGFK